MKKVFIIMGILSIFGCGAKNLSPKETELVNKLGFEIELIKELKKETKNELIQLPGIDQETGDILEQFHNGINSITSEEKGNSIVRKLKEKFRKKGYLIFVYTGIDDLRSIGIIKGKNDLDILRYRRTDGINHDLENQDIVSKISEWNDKFGLNIIGCGRDWLELEFKKMPADLDEFSKEVYEFCPDSVDQGVGEIENLKLMIKQMNGLWLWWD
ncbi:DUF4253 domain-containing protein [Polaribacter sp. KT 15]|uniref:DUF4253 domain-containing protein n=1 Tax=Polaribacter sp. KT 15 TaxID=1896175 RepID=UPI00090B8DEC|nr:DUF4253 domain-containing protein [Polaribacter sp. KT 15]SHM82977.1 protein of unknown function [Polaribacter sp. KT 15]